MSTALATSSPPIEGVLLPVSEEILAQLEKEYAPLTIRDADDAAGIAVVHSARMRCVKIRTGTESARKEINRPHADAIKQNDADCKRLLARLAPIEGRLKSMEDAVEAELAAREQAKADDLYATRRVRLENAGATTIIESIIRKMSEVEFEEEIHRVEIVVRQEHEATVKRLEEETNRQKERAAEVERNRLEAERLANERAEMNRQRAVEQARIDAENARLATQHAEQEAAARVIKSEQDRLAAEESERQRQVALEVARQEAAEKARVSERLRVARDADEAIAKAAADEAARQRAAALKPDREKLDAVADAVAAVKVPEVSLEAVDAAAAIEALIEQTAGKIRAYAATVT